MGCSFKIKRGITIVNTFQKIISKGCKPNKIWVDKGGEFYNNLFKKFWKILKCTQLFMKENHVVAEIFIRTLKNKLFKYMTAVSKNVYFDVLDDIINKYNN